MGDLFAKNLKLLGQHTPVGPLLVGEGGGCQLVSNPDGTLNLSVEGELLYKGIGEEEWFAELDLSGVSTLFVFGVGLGYAYDAARSWLQEDGERHLVFLEDNVAIVRRFLETEQATRVLKDKQVRLHLFAPPVAGNEVFLGLARYYALHPMGIGFLRFYRERRSPFCDEVEEALRVTFYQQQAFAFQDLHPHEVYRTLYPNLKRMGTDLLGEDLFGRFPKVPAILCGAGPSLDAALPLLKEAQDRALFFAGGSALTAMGAAGFRPHFGAGLSPSVSERDRFERANLFEVPLFYSPRICPEAVKAWGGERIATLSGTFRLISWFSKRLGLCGQILEEGPSVMGLLIELAYQMGCDPIILVGVDLAATEGRCYAAGVDALEPVESGEMKWVSEAEQLGQMIERRTGPRYVNVSGGRPIPHTASGDLKALLPELPAENCGDRVAVLLEGIRRPDYQEKVDLLLGELKESMERCITLADQMMGELQRIEREVIQGIHKFAQRILKRERKPEVGKIPPHLASGKLALYQVELEEEIAYRLVLEEMLTARRMYHQRVYDEFLRAAKGVPQLVWQRKVTLEQERAQFIRGAASIQLDLLSSQSMFPSSGSSFCT